MSNEKLGTCSLTGTKGKFVKSHILPKALTKPAVSGAPLMQTTFGQGLKKRFSSWYDPQLVVRKGEDILADADSEGIRELRRLGLIWSSDAFPPQPLEQLSPGLSLLEFCDIDASKIWRLFAACVWRASASKLMDLDYFDLSTDLEDKLASCLLDGTCDFNAVPISLTLLTTVGEIHNHSPTVEKMPVPGSVEMVDIARLYLDGLIAHMHLHVSEREIPPSGALFLGFDNRLVVIGREMDGSAQAERIVSAKLGSFSKPD
ncbi:MAG: hypothetical protein QNI90_01465 [Dinoroseobacter sp.]|nr:hypothetical protein [Dinoroseobacter sp.]